MEAGAAVWAAWVGFTLPSAVLMTLFAYGATGIVTSRIGAELLHGLKLVAVAVVAQAVWTMARSLCPDRARAGIATGAAVLVLVASWSVGQIGAIALGALAGLWLCRARAGTEPERSPASLTVPVSKIAGAVCLAAFAGLLLMPYLFSGAGVAAFAAFYRSGALVFGGGHVVLPLLRDAVVSPGWVTEGSFLAGYGAAQAMPGPLFAFAAYLGAVLPGPVGGVAGAALALLAIFLPGILLLVGVLPFWNTLRARSGAQAALRGINAAVVGLLGAALYDPVWTGAVCSDPPTAPRRCSDSCCSWSGASAPIVVVALGAVAGVTLGIFGG